MTIIIDGVSDAYNDAEPNVNPIESYEMHWEEGTMLQPMGFADVLTWARACLRRTICDGGGGP